MNKKGAEMTIGTIIIIILALVVLVVLVYGFTTGWGNLWEKMTAFGGNKVNVQSVMQSCDLACSTNAKYDFCTLERDVRYLGTGDKILKNKATCETLSALPTSKTTIANVDCENFQC